ncbi:Putative uncharacterized protein [Taphrina deformans PYCC 5710]|uniref:Yeast cell wall synthesis Kre9/Knh1-like N-terminal domain-containing protein n=1 Tax=Taphrina deformans (strain PYCC 5710 / ATCC 11124 / CBS 356.35 / IMI 108563 / JCM 9778 / NBRC 8474) TaxID=1097556 RepID=R4XG49_TAPDE|nr:Putative uncharacterized protein [Taphrina deformans PYCC 5710]|eukprot:CCG82359.1 Putative uncharacterized protein [Taphrina deformans PYCC 5710]
MQFFTTIATLVAATGALMINSPAMNAVWTTGQSHTVSWTSVNTDASAMSIYLVNFSRYPTSSVLLEANVPSSAGSLTIPAANVTSTGSGYQINFLAVDNPSQILAQSNQFSIVAGSAASSAAPAAPAAATTTAAPVAAAAPAAAATSSSSSTVAAVAAASSAAALPVSGNSTLPVARTSGASANAVSVAAITFIGSVLYLL